MKAFSCRVFDCLLIAASVHVQSPLQLYLYEVFRASVEEIIILACRYSVDVKA